jgi:hypothetical protein
MHFLKNLQKQQQTRPGLPTDVTSQLPPPTNPSPSMASPMATSTSTPGNNNKKNI